MAVILKKNPSPPLVLLHPGHHPESAFGVHSQAGRLVKACFLSWPQNTAQKSSDQKKVGKWGGMGGSIFWRFPWLGRKKLMCVPFFLRELMLVFFSFHPDGTSSQWPMYNRTGKTDTTWCWCPSLKPGVMGEPHGKKSNSRNQQHKAA